MEFVYDFHLTLYGVREVAEKELHTLFVGVRKYAPKHPRVRNFALFCGIPMTLTPSTRGGFFNVDMHLAELQRALSKSQPPKPPRTDDDDVEDYGDVRPLSGE